MLKEHFKIIKRYKICQVFLLAFLVFPLCLQAGVIEDLNRRIQEQEAKRQELERQAQEYQNVINQKKGQIKSLNNEIAIFDAQIGKLEIEMRVTEDFITQTELEISQLEYGLDQAEKDIVSQKGNLGELIRTIDEYDETTDLEIILQSEDLSDFFSQKNYLEGVQEKIQVKVENLKMLKTKMTQDKETKEKKKEKLEELKNRVAEQKSSLDYQKSSKQNLLKYTKGEENKYQQLLANIEKQKQSLLGDINQLRLQKAAELARLKELQEKPPAQYWASEKWYFRQDDPRWAESAIGYSGSKMADYGCAISSLAMVFSQKGNAITPGQMARQSIFYYDLIVWPRGWGSASCINCPPAHSSSFDWDRLDRELSAGNPVIVFVRVKGRYAGHYVVVHHKTGDGRYVVHDPLFGANIYLESTQVYISNLYNATTYLDQMVIYH